MCVRKDYSQSFVSLSSAVSLMLTNTWLHYTERSLWLESLRKLKEKFAGLICFALLRTEKLCCVKQDSGSLLIRAGWSSHPYANAHWLTLHIPSAGVGEAFMTRCQKRQRLVINYLDLEKTVKSPLLGCKWKVPGWRTPQSQLLNYKLVPAVNESHTVPPLCVRPSVLLSCCPQVGADQRVETDKTDNIGSGAGGVEATHWEDRDSSQGHSVV